MKLSYKYRTFNVPLRLLRLLKHRMRWVRAAGGVVADDAGDLLLIRRNGRWDLPKGKVENGETLIQAALREVEEETGLQCVIAPMLYCVSANAQITNAILKTYHIYNLYGGWHLKQTSWFVMHTTRHTCRPQTEEGITDCVWVHPDEWRRRLRTSYGTMKTIEQWISSATSH